MVATPLAGVSETEIFLRAAARVRCGKPGLTRRRLVSTLKQSPESRRYGCDPNHLGTAPASSTKTTSGRTADEPDAKRLTAGWQHNEENVVAKGKRTFQPNNRRRARVHGFRLRMRTRAGRAIVSGRRRKGRRALSA